MPTRADRHPRSRQDIIEVGPEGLDRLLWELSKKSPIDPIPARRFLEAEAYRPLPTLVQAARELFNSRRVREVWRAAALTEPAVEYASRIAHEAAHTRTRHLILLTGVPGSGKTLVGLRAVHAQYLDDLAIERKDGKPTTSAVFLSGNDPLVTVLQYEFKGAGGGGKVFVRRIKDYMDHYVPRPDRIPPEHLLVFDEAQRAFSREAVAEKHQKWPIGIARSEPEHFIEISERIPEWCVVVGLIGGGQEIHKGEENGLVQWRWALESGREPSRWTVHGPESVRSVLESSTVSLISTSVLNLDVEIRFHLTTDLHRFVAGLLEGRDPLEQRLIADHLHRPDSESPGGINLWITRDLALAKRYLHERYSENPNARYGIVASSKDKILERDFGVANSYQSTKRVKLGPWYSNGDESPYSCRKLEAVVTEFGAQGLELDMTLLAWGNDLIRVDGSWSDRFAGKYRGGAPVKNPFQLRLNAYRVLLTRGRDGVLVYVPSLNTMDETFSYLCACGFRELPDE